MPENARPNTMLKPKFRFNTLQQFAAFEISGKRFRERRRCPRDLSMEVLTLQFGHFSNHIGAHFWNFEDESAALQDATDEDPAGRGEDPDFDFGRLHIHSERGGVSYWHPRLLLVDKRGALGAFRTGTVARNAGGGEPSLADLWDFSTAQIHADPIDAHQFQDDLEQDEDQEEPLQGRRDKQTIVMDVGDSGDTEMSPDALLQRKASAMKSAMEYDFAASARTWTDFIKLRLPQASVHELQTVHHGAAPFATFFDGLELRGRGDEESVLDMTRRQLELCDRLDAVHTIVDFHDGFGGLGELALCWLREEQPKCGQFVLAVSPEVPEAEVASRADISAASSCEGPAVGLSLDRDAVSWLSAAFSFASLLEHDVDAWVPAVVPLWSAQPPRGLRFDRSCAYESSAVIATALQTATLPYRLCGTLRPSHFLGALTPSHRPACGLLQALPLPAPPFLTPGRAALADLTRDFFDLTSVRPSPLNPHTSMVLRGCHPRQLLQWCGGLAPPARRLCYSHGPPLPLPVPFPQFFAPAVSRHGIFANSNRDGEVEATPCATRLHAVAGAGGRCGALRRMAATAKGAARSAWAAPLRDRFGVEADEFREVFELVSEHFESAAATTSDSGCSEGFDSDS